MSATFTAPSISTTPAYEPERDLDVLDGEPDAGVGLVREVHGVVHVDLAQLRLAQPAVALSGDWGPSPSSTNQRPSYR